MSQSSDLVGSIVKATQIGDIAGAMRYLSELRAYLHDSGSPIGDRNSLRLIEALCDTPTFKKIPTRFERTQSELINEIGAQVGRVVDKSSASRDPDREIAKIRSLWSELDRLLTDAGVPIENADAVKLIRDLRKVRTFDLLAKTSDRLMARGYQDNGLARRMYAQALIDSGQLFAGIGMLMPMLDDPNVSADEKAEALGVLGRAYKQLYVDTIDSAAELVVNRRPFEAHLQNAIDYYRKAVEAFKSEMRTWPQINLIALVNLAKRDGCAIANAPDADALARSLIEQEEPKALSSDDPYVSVNVAEAYFALGQTKKAAQYYNVFVNHKNAGPFEIGSALRQLEQVWRIKADTSDEGQIVAGLKAALAGKSNGVLTLTGEERAAIAQSAGSPPAGGIYETVCDGGKFIKFSRFQEIVRCGASVARIRRPDYFAHGTGFLVRGEELSAELEPGMYLLTNSHVISDDPAERREHGSLLPKEARVIFEAEASEGQAKVYELEPNIVWRSPIGRHDATLVRFATPCAFKALTLAPRGQLPIAEDATRQKQGTTIALLGHPAEAPLSLSVMGSLENKDGEVVDIGGTTKGAKDPIYLHYRTPTEGGNSGSPVFSTENDKWAVIGLHHAGFDKAKGRPRLDGKPGTNFANEGVWVDSIRAAIDGDKKGGGKGRK